ncbi:MAG: ribonuclease HIII [Solobacterium sp.]|nr:ribonuclease HIII [Solobacterium sp.]
MSTITLNITKELSDQIYHDWHTFGEEKHPQYTHYQLRLENCVITSYTSGKIVFQGKDAEVYASPYQKKDTVGTHAGSDEVGTGDYFGPVCVCAVCVREEQLPLLQELGIRDSKMITDEVIRKIAPVLQKELVHSLLILPPARYNEIHKTRNMNAIKAEMHNQAFLNLKKKTTLPDLIVIDQFTPEAQYYRYLSRTENVVRNIRFETKAENKYPAVAAGSILARYAFLHAMDKLNEAYDMVFEKGGGSPADQSASEFVRRYGMERLHEVAKIHFKNTEKITL